MSEYQYYEFQAIDHRLSDEQMRQLRRYSTRAEITSSSFVNEYHWGDFKGNPDRWMEKYFDAFLYFANWGTSWIQIAFPAEVLPLKTARSFCAGDVVSCREKAGRLIFSIHFHDESGVVRDEGGDGILSSIIGIRDEIVQGDLRSLYLAWLVAVESRLLEDEEEEKEPPVPPNLSRLSEAQKNLVKFFGVGPDLIAVAARNSSTASDNAVNEDERRLWIAKLSVQEKDALLARLMEGEAAKIGMELQARFRAHRTSAQAPLQAEPRTAGQLLALADDLRKARAKEKALRAAETKERQAQLAAAAKAKHLDSLKGRSIEIWMETDALAATRLPKSYDLAARHVADLRDLAELEGSQEEFRSRHSAFRDKHSAKKNLLERLPECD